MVPATDSAFKSPARWAWIGLSVAACLLDSGCSRLRTSRRGEPPMLGAAAPFDTAGKRSADRALASEENDRPDPDARPRLARGGREGAGSGSGTVAPRASSASEAKAPEPSLDGAPTDSVQALDVTLPGQGPASLRDATTDARPSSRPGNSPSSERAGQPKAGQASTTVASLISDARERIDQLATYQVPIKRQERVGATLLPAEEVLLSIRRQPRAVRLEWPTGPHKGREVIYSATENQGLMHVNMADSVVPVPPLALPPDSPLVLRSSRHPITEAGFDAIVTNLEKTLILSGAGDKSQGKVEYAGLENPGQLERPSHKLVRVTPSGENWQIYLDPGTKLPVMVQANAANGDLLERYLFGTPKRNPPELASADAFDTTRRWGQPKGLLQRLARANGARNDEEAATR